MNDPLYTCHDTKTTTSGSSYDAEDFQIGSGSSSRVDSGGDPLCTDSYSQVNTSYRWGPTGHPINVYRDTGVPSKNINESLHWDGDTLLFTTNGAGAVTDIKLGSIADYSPTDSAYQGLTVWDRDTSGFLASSHNSTGIGGWLAPDPFNVQYSVYAGSNQNYKAPQSLIATTPRSDGQEIAGVVFQGVRAYDPTTAAWKTPDAYQGDVQDPMSRKSFVWNRNNPMIYSDPSGFNANVEPDQYSIGDSFFGGPGDGAQPSGASAPETSTESAVLALTAYDFAQWVACLFVPCHGVHVIFSNQNGIDHGYRNRIGPAGWKAPRIPQAVIRDRIIDDLQIFATKGQLLPGQKLENAINVQGDTIVYRAFYAPTGGVIWVSTYGWKI